MEKLEVSLTENGAAEEVPGSNLILNIGNKLGVLDIGWKYKEGEENECLDFNAKKADFLLVSHGHMDHGGKILQARTEGLDCPIYCTAITADILTKIQMPQQACNYWMNVKIAGDLAKKGITIPVKKVPWTYQDFKYIRDNLIQSFYEPDSEGRRQLGYPYETPIKIMDEKDTKITSTAYEAGHIPGSEQSYLEIIHKGKKYKILNSCDLGRTDYFIPGHPAANTPIVKKPHTDFPKDTDIMVIESTYGNKVHSPLEESIRVLERTINDASKRKGKLIIPAFSIMRTHMLVYFIHDLDKKRRLPDNMYFYLTSPGADKLGRIMFKHLGDLDKETLDQYIDEKDNFYYFDRMIHHNKVQKTKDLLALRNSRNPYGIIASSGMCEGGRIERILRQELPDPRNIVLLTGFQAPGTRGYLLDKGETKIPFFDKVITRRAEVRRMKGLSGHADIEELVAHVKNIYNPLKDKRNKPFKIFIKHGEKESCWAVRNRLIKEGYNSKDVLVMKKGLTYDLTYLGEKIS